MRICFVCMGNICRSPTAEEVLRRLVVDAGLTNQVTIDSAGIGAWHVGELPDPRSRAAAAARGYQLTHRARRFTADDFARFDLILAMDRENYVDLYRLARGRTVPSIRLLRSFDGDAPEGADVPDPYAGDAEGFDHVVELCERACRGLLEHLRARI